MGKDRRVDLLNILYTQLEFMGIEEAEKDIIYIHSDEAIERTLFCFSRCKDKYLEEGIINAYNSVQWFVFLYYMTNTIFINQIAEKSNSECGGVGDYATNYIFFTKHFHAVNYIMR